MRVGVPVIPIRQALVRRDLWAGCDRMGLTALGGVSALIGLGGGVGLGAWWLALVGGAIFWVGRELLRKAAKVDPLLLPMWLRTLAHKPVYDACARWDQPDMTGRRRWR